MRGASEWLRPGVAAERAQQSGGGERCGMAAGEQPARRAQEHRTRSESGRGRAGRGTATCAAGGQDRRPSQAIGRPRGGGVSARDIARGARCAAGRQPRARGERSLAHLPCSALRRGVSTEKYRALRAFHARVHRRKKQRADGGRVRVGDLYSRINTVCSVKNALTPSVRGSNQGICCVSRSWRSRSCRGCRAATGALTDAGFNRAGWFHGADVARERQ